MSSQRVPTPDEVSRPVVTICGLGPGSEGALTAETRSLLAGDEGGPGPVFLRTRRHPSAAVAGDTAMSFDDLYDRGSTLSQVYNDIAGRLAREASEHGRVVYAVPGSPLVLERSVALLRSRSDIDVDLRPAVSFLDEAWARLRVDPVEESVRLVDGHTFARQAAGERGPLLVAHAHAPWVLSDIKLAVDAGPEQRVVVLQRLGTPDEHIVEVGWPELDRLVEPDHLTSLYLPEVASPVAYELVRSVELMHRLRADCPWDQKQTHGSLRRHLLEEAHEVLEALDALTVADSVADPEARDDAMFLLEEELGDLWFQILFHAELAAEQGRFDVADVAKTMTDKLIARHPHVFESADESGTVVESGAVADADLAVRWEAAKKAEKSRESVMDGIPPSLPALALADKVLGKAARHGQAVGDEWLAAQGTDPADEAALGRHLLGVVERARRSGLDSEAALRAAARQTEALFRDVEHAPSARWVLG